MEFNNILVFGCGKSGIGAASLLIRQGHIPGIFDSNKNVDIKGIKEKIKEDLTNKGFEDTHLADDVVFYVGDIPEEVVSETDLLVLSPGVPLDNDVVLRFDRNRTKLWGEIELAYHYEKGFVLGITGTNGKTTTTTLVGDIMKALCDGVYVVGNIGYAYTDHCDSTSERSITVAEISSFQLETVDTFKAGISAILNVTPDHLNRHHTMEGYAEAKARVANRHDAGDYMVLNYDNEYTRAFGEKYVGKKIYFSTEEQLKNGIFLNQDLICLGFKGHIYSLMNIHNDMNLVGICNVQNVMAAIGMALAVDLKGVLADCANSSPEVGDSKGLEGDLELKDFFPSWNRVLNVIRSFKAVEHRIEYSGTKNGVVYYNDSKATNPDAAIQGIRAMDRPTILIGGGYDKGNEFDEWIQSFDGRVKLLVLIGETAGKIEECALRNGFDGGRIRHAGSFEECLDICTSSAEEGDAVLLSPACASWGMFNNYEQRGDIFKNYVNSL